MKFVTKIQVANRPRLAWVTMAIIGCAAPVLAMLMLADAAEPAPLTPAGGPILALGLMGAGMIAAAADGRLWIGVLLALLNAALLVFLARALGMPSLPSMVSIGLVSVIASISFAARGALFARSALDKGWMIALFVVAGEAAILLTALAMPGALPDWLLVLLPAQWANVAIQTALGGSGTFEAVPVLLALAGTAASTLLVAKLLPRRWPYLIMFSAWLGLSALVWYWPVLSGPAIS